VAGPIIASPLLVRICLFFRCVSLRSICIERNDNMFAVASVFFWEADLEVLARYFFKNIRKHRQGLSLVFKRH
jgi:hypothetical protein